MCFISEAVIMYIIHRLLYIFLANQLNFTSDDVLCWQIWTYYFLCLFLLLHRLFVNLYRFWMLDILCMGVLYLTFIISVSKEGAWAFMLTCTNSRSIRVMSEWIAYIARAVLVGAKPAHLIDFSETEDKLNFIR